MKDNHQSIISKQNSGIFFVIFTISGFSGLIYESIWTHYLKLFLGHAAYAQTLVLAIFMGGMALGSCLCSRYSGDWKNLFIGYAVAEGLIGLFALFFHTIFTEAVQISYTNIIPYLGTPLTVKTYKWLLSAMLILPQSILLGVTFPLMSAAIIRRFPQKPGRSISLLYFTNSIGAAIGVLVSGFLLIRLVGLPGTVRIAGLINICIALIVWLLAGSPSASYNEFTTKEEVPTSRQSTALYIFFLIAALITGAASFIYEIGWIRMLSLVLGSSTHAFELMLSAFILGLAFGGLWIERRIDRIDTIRYLFLVQLIMGILALSTLLVYGNTFEAMQWIFNKLSKTETGYTIFNLSSHAIALAVMLPATFCAGMTLPLITFALIREGYGERSIGAVYAANTVGAILGVFFAVHIGMPLMGLKGLIIFGAVLDISLGLAILWGVSYSTIGRGLPIIITAGCISIVMATILLVRLDPYKMASGVYRHGIFLRPEENKLIYHEDGKTATVSLAFDEKNSVMSIRTNGKSDASIIMDPSRGTTSDEATMILSGAIPMGINPHARTAAVIGLGSGLTSHTLLSNKSLERVDTIEIEEKMVEAAKQFGRRVELVFKDQRSKIYIDDAKTFFSTYNKKYDIIVSEPSNPWVSGVSGLFSEEFYHLVKRNLSEHGLFIQWLQFYEIDIELVASVLKAVSSNFSDFVIYAPDNGDILIVAKANGPVPDVDPELFDDPRISRLLSGVHIAGIQDIEARKVGNKMSLIKFLDTFPIDANSDYYPVLDQNAARSRFLGINAQELLALSGVQLPIMEMLTNSIPSWTNTDVTPTSFYSKTQSIFLAMAMRDYYLYGNLNEKYGDMPIEIRNNAEILRRMFYDCNFLSGPKRKELLFDVAINIVTYLRLNELDAIWKILESGPCTKTFSSLEKEYISFFKAVGRRDAELMASTAKTLLNSDQEITPVRIQYLVAAGMLGNLAQRNKAESYKLWSAYKNVLFGNGKLPLLFRFLVANSV